MPNIQVLPPHSADSFSCRSGVLAKFFSLKSLLWKFLLFARNAIHCTKPQQLPKGVSWSSCFVRLLHQHEFALLSKMMNVGLNLADIHNIESHPRVHELAIAQIGFSNKALGIRSGSEGGGNGCSHSIDFQREFTDSRGGKQPGKPRQVGIFGTKMIILMMLWSCTSKSFQSCSKLQRTFCVLWNSRTCSAKLSLNSAGWPTRIFEINTGKPRTAGIPWRYCAIFSSRPTKNGRSPKNWWACYAPSSWDCVPGDWPNYLPLSVSQPHQDRSWSSNVGGRSHHI